MIRKILIAVAAVLAGFLLVAALKPADYLIQREIVIQAKPEAIFPYLVSMKKADQWMPWKEGDPQVVTSYSGPEEGVGAISSWESPGQMGTGQAEVVGVTPNQLVKTKITYTKPMVMSQDSEFSLAPDAGGTRVAWRVTGQQPFIPRLICTLMFMNLDKFVGGEFEKGLGKLKLILEKNP